MLKNIVKYMFTFFKSNSLYVTVL